MAQMTGADIGDLESGAARLESVGNEIGAMRRPLRSQLYSSYWEGRAAERFRSEWDTVHGPALSNAEDFLRNAGQQLHREAEEQRQASGVGRGRKATPHAQMGPAVEDDGGGLLGWFRDRATDVREGFERALPWVGAATGLVPTLVAGLAVATGNSIQDTSRILLETTVNVLDEGDLLSPRQRAFVRFVKLVTPVGVIADGVALSVTAADMGIDFVRFGRDSEEFRSEYQDLISRGVDTVSGGVTQFPEALFVGMDLATGEDYAARTRPSYWLERSLTESADAAFGSRN